MSITKNSDRQYALAAEVEFTYADFVSGVFQPAIEVPPGAVITGGMIVIDTAFNSGTSDTMTVGDEDTNNLYETSVNAQSAAKSDLVPTGKEYTATNNVGIKLTSVGAAATAGAGRLLVTYQRSGRANENQG